MLSSWSCPADSSTDHPVKSGEEKGAQFPAWTLFLPKMCQNVPNRSKKVLNRTTKKYQTYQKVGIIRLRWEERGSSTMPCLKLSLSLSGQISIGFGFKLSLILSSHNARPAFQTVPSQIAVWDDATTGKSNNSVKRRFPFMFVCLHLPNFNHWLLSNIALCESKHDWGCAWCWWWVKQ